MYPLDKCPRFERCSKPLCPLDSDKKLRMKYPEEPICTLPNNILRKIKRELIKLK